MEPVKYGVHDKPPFKRALPLALQQVLTIFAGTLSGALMLASGTGMNESETALVIQCSMFICCVASLIQCLGIPKLGIGARLPIVTSGSYTLVAPMVVLALNPKVGLSGTFGAALVGSLVLFLLGPIIIKYLYFLFTPTVTGSVVLSVGMCLMVSGYRHAVNGAPDSPEVLKCGLIALLTFLIALCFNTFAKGFLQNLSILIAIAVGYLLCVALNMVDFTPVQTAAAVSLPQPVRFGLSFQIGPIITICVVHIATIMENIGDTTSIVDSAEHRLPTKEELMRTMRGNGLSSMIAAVFNGLPVISSSANAGVIAMSGVPSRYVSALGGILMGLLSFFPKYAQVFALMPKPVLGGITLIIMGRIAASGINIVSMAPMTKRNLTILAVSIAIGIGGNYGLAYLSFLPETLVTLMTGIPGTALSAILLNVVLPKSEEDKSYHAQYAKNMIGEN
ncbi:MAG: purine/pyrimidine permease [Oscillospiraceae bacterium]|nr:purine/pyrimidine permease [Oscillospiraceae bacterium]